MRLWNSCAAGAPNNVPLAGFLPATHLAFRSASEGALRVVIHRKVPQRLAAGALLLQGVEE